MTTAEAAEHSRHHPKTVERAARSGELRGVQRGGRGGSWRFQEFELDLWIKGKGKKRDANAR
ncbi:MULTISPECIES: helix-turn-helix domain-containing protein [Nocardia]